MKEIITDFKGLKAHVKASGLKFHDAVIDYYRTLGEKQGFTPLKDSTVIRNAHNFGKLDLVWAEPNVAFVSEFGLFDDIYRHLWRIMVHKPKMAVILLSGNSQCSPRKVRELVSRTPQLEGIDFLVLDVTGGKTA